MENQNRLLCLNVTVLVPWLNGRDPGVFGSFRAPDELVNPRWLRDPGLIKKSPYGNFILGLISSKNVYWSIIWYFWIVSVANFAILTRFLRFNTKTEIGGREVPLSPLCGTLQSTLPPLKNNRKVNIPLERVLRHSCVRGLIWGWNLDRFHKITSRHLIVMHKRYFWRQISKIFLRHL